MSDVSPSELTESAPKDMLKPFNKAVYIDQDKQAARELTATLEALQYEVVACASNAFEAVRMITMYDPDVVLLEVTLQKRWDGIALARYLKDNFRAAIVFITADTQVATLDQALALHPQGFLNKPCRPLDVRNSLALARKYIRVPLSTKGSLQGRLEKIGGALPALQLLTTLTTHGKLVFDDGATIVVSRGHVVDVQHPSGQHNPKQALEHITRRQQGHFCVDTLDMPPIGSLRVAVNGLLLQHQVDTDDIDRALHDFRMLSLEAIDPHKHPAQFTESDSLIIEALTGDDSV